MMNADWMGGPDQLNEADAHRRIAAKRFRASKVTLVELWTYYYGIGGDVDELALDAYLNEALHLPAAQVGLVTLAMNEFIGGDGA